MMHNDDSAIERLKHIARRASIFAAMDKVAWNELVGMLQEERDHSFKMATSLSTREDQRSWWSGSGEGMDTLIRELHSFRDGSWSRNMPPPSGSKPGELYI